MGMVSAEKIVFEMRRRVVLPGVSAETAAGGVMAASSAVKSRAVENSAVENSAPGNGRTGNWGGTRAAGVARVVGAGTADGSATSAGDDIPVTYIGVEQPEDLPPGSTVYTLANLASLIPS